MKRSDVELRRAVRIYRRAVIGRNAHDEMTEDARMRMATALWDASKDSALTPQAREFFEAMHGSLDGHARACRCVLGMGQPVSRARERLSA